MFNDLSSPLSLLTTRRSGKPRDMVEPGPDADQLQQILGIAARTPDHGKLAPWRFVVIDRAAQDAFAARLVAAYRAEKPDAGRLEIDAIDAFARQAPSLVVLLSTPVPGSHIPLWEQQLSAGAAAMNLLHGAHAMGFVASWLTGWPAYSDAVRDLLGADGEDRIAGFLFIGSPGKPLSERPRPEISDKIAYWSDDRRS